MTGLIGDDSRLLQTPKGKAEDGPTDIEMIGKDAFSRQSIRPLAGQNGETQPFGGLLRQGTSRDRVYHVEESHRTED
jgi:hypothetical protein